MFHTCFESRQVALKARQLQLLPTFRNDAAGDFLPNNLCHSLINPAEDTIFIRDEHQMTCDLWDAERYDDFLVDEIQHLALQVSDLSVFEVGPEGGAVTLLLQFPGLKTVR